MSICVVVSNDDGARAASHALRGAGWGGVHFEANPDAAQRVAAGGRATVLNVNRLSPAEADAALAALGDAGHDWRVDPPQLNEEEWAVLYDNAERFAMTPKKAANRRASAAKAMGVNEADLADAFESWRLPAP